MVTLRPLRGAFLTRIKDPVGAAPLKGMTSDRCRAEPLERRSRERYTDGPFSIPRVMSRPNDFSRRRALSAVAGLATLLPAASARGQFRRRANAAEGSPRPNSAEERRALDVIEDVYANYRYLSVPREDGRLLRILAESIGAQRVIELGTSTGYSGLWLLLALNKTGGKLMTYEIDEGRHAMARANFERAGLGRLATLVLGDAHEQVTNLKGPVDLVFIDADKEGYPDYLRKLMPLVRSGGLIVAHNMASPPPDPEYVHAVTTNPALDTVFVNMDSAGVGITLKKR
jgi:caffeoyl-CoA O-methyltransferase